MASRKSAAQKSYLPIVGRWTFLAGMIVAIISGLIPSESFNATAQEWVGYILMALGLVAGYFHFDKENQGQFILLAVGVAIFSNSFASIPTVGNYIVGMLSTLAFFFGVAVIGIVIRNVVGWFTEQF